MGNRTKLANVLVAPEHTPLLTGFSIKRVNAGIIAHAIGRPE